MRIDRSFYNEQFFHPSVYGSKVYRSSDGSIKISASTPNRNQWDEWSKIFLCLRKLFQFDSILDVGCGCGYSITKAVELGFKAIGIDYSSAAIEVLAWEKAINKLIVAEATSLPFRDASFDLVISSSLFEHLYFDEIDRALSEILRVTYRWVFLNIDIGEEVDYTLDSGVDVPLELEESAVKGHVTMKPATWWKQKINDAGLIMRNDLSNAFLLELPMSFYSNSLKCICEKKNGH